MSPVPRAFGLPPPEPIDIASSALFLDLDGTLAPLCDHPDGVEPDSRVIGLLRRLETRLKGRLAVVSGRTLGDVDRILEGSVRNGAGVHGLERRGPGGLERAAVHPGLDAARRRLAQFADRTPGVLVEEKGLALTLHYRGAPQAQPACAALAAEIATATGLRLQSGAMVYELRTPGADKGEAVRSFMAEAPFVGAAPIFVGDDLTDEDGFSGAAALGGFGVLVGPLRPTLARRRLPSPGAVLDWLEASLD